MPTLVEKHCSGCKNTKPVNEFKPNRSRKDGLSAWCRECSRTSQRESVARNKEQHKTKNEAFRAQRALVAKQFVLEYLRAHPCCDCGEPDVIVLEFDHRDNKKVNVAELTARGYSLETVKAEIAKCDVRCANCHRRRTAKQFGWWKATAE